MVVTAPNPFDHCVILLLIASPLVVRHFTFLVDIIV